MRDIIMVDDNTVKISNDYLISSNDPSLNKVIRLLIQKDIIGSDLKNKAIISHLREVEKFIEKNYLNQITENNENDILKYAEKEGKGKVLAPLRLVLSGENNSNNYFEILKAIGKPASLRRINKLLEKVGTDPKELDTKTSNTSGSSEPFTLQK